MMSSLGTLIRSVGGLLSTHLSMLQLDLLEEKERLTQLLMLLIGVAVFAVLFLVMLTVLVMLFFWDTSALGAALGLTVFYALGVSLLVYKIRRHLRSSVPFAATLDELKKDREAFFND